MKYPQIDAMKNGRANAFATCFLGISIADS